ncbi:MAG: alpha/beta fold hydrolase [Hyphomonas sp.]
MLINLHGGGFITCWPACAELESMPLAALGGFRVVAVDYRQAPEHKFPAASEDVAAVYSELLKEYPAENIGIFGCSAGGMLTGMSLAWFQKHGLPTPGAAGIYCAGSAAPINGFGGDANFTATAIGEARFIALPPKEEDPDAPKRSRMPYLSEADPYDPLVAPAESDEVLANFPPTQFITGTRSFELSSAVYTHSRLVKLGVKADLHVWEGMFHGFYSNPDVPESQDAYKVMIDFFNTHLGK